ncbi:hypothetical protein L9F63_002870, partial [Diploptera punctata]
MGIRGLQTYIEQGLPNAYCYEVNLKELADIYRRDTGRRPVMVVDGPIYLREMAGDMEDQYWILGGQLKEFVETSKHFVACFKTSFLLTRLMPFLIQLLLYNLFIRFSALGLSLFDNRWFIAGFHGR